MSNSTIYTVTTSIKFEGAVNRWIFASLTEAAKKYDDIVGGYNDVADRCDVVTLAGPFYFGDDVNNGSVKIVCRHDFDLFRDIAAEVGWSPEPDSLDNPER